MLPCIFHPIIKIESIGHTEKQNAENVLCMGMELEDLPQTKALWQQMKQVLEMLLQIVTLKECIRL
jgi:hypothetical protein